MLNIFISIGFSDKSIANTLIFLALLKCYV